MRFPQAWANIAKENVSLKIVLFCTSTIAVLMSIGFLKSSLKDPIVVERSCKTQILKEKAQEAPTAKEIKEFLNIALVQRFTSGKEVEKSFFSKSELKVRGQEEETFKDKKIKQLVIVRDILITEKTIAAEVDRVFSMGKARPAYPSTLVLDVQQIKRTLKNPYGLVINKIETLKIDKKKEGGQQ